MNWWFEWKWPILASVLIASFAFVGASAAVHYRERQCAEKCHMSGANSFEYTGFSSSGLRGRLSGDVCKCVS